MGGGSSLRTDGPGGYYRRGWGVQARLWSMEGSVVGSSSLRQLPGRWRFQRVLPGRQLVVDLADEKKKNGSFFPDTLLLYVFRLLEYLVTS